MLRVLHAVGVRLFFIGRLAAVVGRSRLILVLVLPREGRSRTKREHRNENERE